MPAVREISSRRMNTVTLSIPMGSQTAFLRSLSRNMGWKMKVARPKPVEKEDPTLMTKEEFYAMIDEAKEEVRQGKVGPTFSSAKEMFEYIESLAE